MIKKSPRLHQNFMNAYRERLDILNQDTPVKSELSQQLELQYEQLIQDPLLKKLAELEQLLLQIRTIDNMDEIKYGEYAGYNFARTAFPRLDVKSQHLRVYLTSDKPEDQHLAAPLLKLEMEKIFTRNLKLFNTENKLVKNIIEPAI